MIEHIEVDLELTANGRVAFEMPRFTAVVEPVSLPGSVTLTGTLVNIHAPGEGQLLIEVGRIVVDLASGNPLFSAGRFMIMDGELGKVCSFFAAGPCRQMSEKTSPHLSMIEVMCRCRGADRTTQNGRVRRIPS